MVTRSDWDHTGQSFRDEAHNKRCFRYRCLRDCDFRNCSLRESDFTGANLELAVFDGADLTGAIFRGCDLKHTSFKGAIMESCIFGRDGPRTTVFGSRTLEEAATIQKSYFGDVQMQHVDLEGTGFFPILDDDNDDDSDVDLPLLGGGPQHYTRTYEEAVRRVLNEGVSSTELTVADLLRPEDRIEIEGALGIRRNNNSTKTIDLTTMFLEDDGEANDETTPLLGGGKSMATKELVERLLNPDNYNEPERFHDAVARQLQRPIRLDFSGCTFGSSYFANRAFEDCRFDDVNFGTCDLSRCLFRGCSFRRAKLQRTVWRGIRCYDCIFVGADMTGLRLTLDMPDNDVRGANLTDVVFPLGVRLAGTDFSGSILVRVVFKNHDLSDCSFVGADLTGAKLLRCQVSRADFQGATLDAADLRGTAFADTERMALVTCSPETRWSKHAFAKANFRGATLIGLDLTRMPMDGCDLTGADLRGCRVHPSIVRAKLVSCNLIGVVLPRTIEGVDLTGVQFGDLTKSKFRTCTFGPGTTFTGTVNQCHFDLCGFNQSLLKGSIWNGVRFTKTSFRNVDFTSTKRVSMVRSTRAISTGCRWVLGVQFTKTCYFDRCTWPPGQKTGNLGSKSTTIKRCHLPSAIMNTPTFKAEDSDLSGFNGRRGGQLELIHCDLTNSDWRGATLTGSLQGSCLLGAKLGNGSWSVDATDTNVRYVNFKTTQTIGSVWLRARTEGSRGLDATILKGGSVDAAVTNVKSRESWAHRDLVDMDHSKLISLLRIQGRGLDLTNSALPKNLVLKGLNLRGAIFNGVLFNGVRFIDCDLRDTSWWQCRFEAYVDLGTSDLGGADLRGVSSVDMCLNKVSNLANACLDGARLVNFDFSYKDLSGASFKHARLRNSCWDGTTIDRADFSRADLSGARGQGLTGLRALFRATNLENTAFVSCTLDEVNLNDSSCIGAKWTKIVMRGASFVNASLMDASLDHCNLVGSRMNKCVVSGATFENTDFEDVILLDVDLRSVKSLRRCRFTNLFRKDLRGVDMGLARLSGCDARGANFHGTNLTCVDMREAKLDRTRFGMARIVGGRFDRAQIRNVHFDGRDLTDTTFDGATITDCTFQGVVLRGATFRGAVLSQSTSFRGLSLIRVSFVKAMLDGVDMALTVQDNCDYTDASLRETDWRKSRAKGLCFRNACWGHGLATELQLTRCDLIGTDLTRAMLDKATLLDCDLSQATLQAASLLSADLSGCRLHHMNAKNAAMDGIILDRCHANRADFEGARFQRSRARGAVFTDCVFRFADGDGATWFTKVAVLKK